MPPCPQDLSLSDILASTSSITLASGFYCHLAGLIGCHLGGFHRSDRTCLRHDLSGSGHEGAAVLLPGFAIR